MAVKKVVKKVAKKVAPKKKAVTKKAPVKVAKKAAPKKKAVAKATTKKVAPKKKSIPAKKAVAKKAAPKAVATKAVKKSAPKKVAPKKAVVKKSAVKTKPSPAPKEIKKPTKVVKSAPVAPKKPAKQQHEPVIKKEIKAPKKSAEIAVKQTDNKTMNKKMDDNKKPKPVVKTHKPSPIDNLPIIEPYHETSGEDYMNAVQKQHFRNMLNQWKQDLMSEVDRTMDYMKDEAANFPDPADRATQEEEFNLELRTRDRERKLIKKIDEALERIEEDDYGYCEACGIEIGTRRLEARPTATLCIDCKTVDEIRERQLLA